MSFEVRSENLKTMFKLESATRTISAISLLAISILVLYSSRKSNPAPLSAETRNSAILQINCPPSDTVSCLGEVKPPFTTIQEFVDDGGVVTSDCNLSTLIFDGVFMTTRCLFTRTYIITDDCGGMSDCDQTIKVNDVTSPSIVCPGEDLLCSDPLPTAYTSYNQFFTQVTALGGSISDNCGIDTASFLFSGQITSFSVNRPKCLNTIEFNYIIKDSCGNGSFCRQPFTFRDNIKPTFIPARDTTLYLDAACFADTSANALGMISNLSDNCGIDSMWYNDRKVASCNIAAGTLQRIWKVRDNCGNIAVDTQFVQILDTIRPTIMGPRDTALMCAGNIPLPNPNLIIGTDNCSALLIKTFAKDSVSDSTCLNKKTIIRIYKASDQCLNETTFRQTIIIKDTVPPNMVCPPALGLTCDSAIPSPDPASVTATDNCDGSLLAVFQKDSVGIATCVNNKTVFRIFTATDTCRNTARCVQILSVKDTVPPILTCPVNLTISCASATPAPNPGSVTRSDNCTGTVVVSFAKDSITNQLCSNKKLIHRIYTGTDECLNMSRCIQVININDTIAPLITCPAGLSVECMSEIPVVDIATVTASDNCGATPTISLQKDSIVNQSCVNKKDIYRLYQAVDSCFNLVRCLQIIHVNDTTPPTLIGESNSVTLDCNVSFEVEIPTATDNCNESVPVITSTTTIDSLCPGTYKIVWSFIATDSCNNSVSRSDTLSYLDETPPSIMCPSNKQIECTENPYSALDSFFLAGGFVEDLCGLDSSSFEMSDEQIAIVDGLIQITRTYSITDLCGLTASCQQILTTPGCFTDLALKKYVNAQTPYFVQPGDQVPICVVIYNQGLVAVDSIKLIEYFPSKATHVLSDGWIDNGNGTACRYLSQENGLIPMGGFLPGDTILFCFDIQLGLDVTLPESINRIEINEVRNLSGNPLPDIDSTPDDDPNNDSGGVPNSPDDDKIDGDSRLGEDEDDSDPTVIYVCFPLNCLAQANVSFDALGLMGEAGEAGTCTHCLEASEILTGRLLPNEFYEIEIFNSFGTQLPSNCIGREYLGQRLTYSISAPGCSKNKNSCWGYITMEDKSPPVLDCSDQFIYCNQITSLPTLSNAPDNCSGAVLVITNKSEWIDYGCDSVYYGVVVRTISATDTWNNRSTCEKKYYIRKINLDSVICPQDVVLDCTFNSITAASTIHPNRTGTPTYQGVNLWPSGPACHLFIDYTDQRTNLCGKGIEIFRTWIIGDHCTGRERKCSQIIKVTDLTPPVVFGLNRHQVLTADPHDCIGLLNLPALSVSDCNNTTQSFVYTYFNPENPNISETQSGALPAKIKIHIGLNNKVKILIKDECTLFTQDSILVDVYDRTPPTPLCLEYTQVTLDPDGCWAQVAASSLDVGSHDNCCQQLHFAAAFMDDIDKAKTDYLAKLESDCGKTEYWNNKDWYDKYIDDWINCYVFKDTIHLGECGTRRVVLRVYEACDLPLYDPHVFPCSPHAWFCYNTSWNYRIQFNKSFNKKGSNKDCGFTAPWGCKSILTDSINASTVYALGYYQSFPLDRNCNFLFGSYPDSIICRPKLYNDCMIEVLADDKTAPACESLEDIEIFCDMVPYNKYNQAWSACPTNETYASWPLDIKRSGDPKIYGYYGGSIISNHDDHNSLSPGCGYSNKEGDWAPIYCRKWLELDTFDTGRKVDTSLFSRPVIVDKKHLRRALMSNEFYIKDNCIVDSLTYKDDGSVNTCGEGWLLRTWLIKDKCGNITYCSQKIIVKHRSDFEVLFPADKVIDCTNANQTGPDQAGRPVIMDDDCEQVGVEFKDDTFEVADDACYKIIRTWTLIDACIYESSAHVKYPDVIVDDRRRADEANDGSDRYCVFRNLKDNGDGFMRYVQIIKVIDTIAPKLTCKDTTICFDGANCSAIVNLPLKATDNCATTIWFDIKIDKDANGTIDGILTHVDHLSGSFSPGKYAIEVKGYDHCSNVGTCTFTMTIKDCKAPTPYCINGVATVIMPSSGTIEVWASDLNLSSSDNCTQANKLLYSFNPEGTLKSQLFKCTDLINGRSATVSVDIWVIDEAGNKDVCKTYILLQDNGNPGICPDNESVPLLINLSGRLATEDGETIENTDLVLSPVKSGIPLKVNSADGQFHIPGVPNTTGVILAPHKDNDPMNGVSTLDLILIEKHIKGEQLLNSPFKMVAADVNRSGDIDIIDLVELRKLILGLYDKLPSSESWRFIPKNYTFKDLQHPFDYPMSMNIINEPDDLAADFTGLKVGDVNSTALAHRWMGTEIRSEGPGLILQAKNSLVKKGDFIDLVITSPNFRGISGLQGTLHTPGLQFISLAAGDLDLSESNIGHLNEDLLTISWHHPRSVDLPGDGALFTLRFKATQDLNLSEMIWIGSDHTRAESYQGIGEIQNLSLEFTDPSGTLLTKASNLLQNYPNPFNSQTTIGLRLESETKGVLSLFDINGRVIKRIEKTWTKGYQEIMIKDQEVHAPGIYFYQFESNIFTERRKMIFKP